VRKNRKGLRMKKIIFKSSAFIFTLSFIFLSCEPRNIVDVQGPPVPRGVRLFSPDWEQTEELDGYSITALEQSYNSYIIAATSSGNLFRTKSDGSNWTLAPAGNTPVTTIHRSINNLIFTGTNSEGLFYSNTNGRTWSLLRPFSDIIFDIITANDNSVIIGTSSGMYKSTDISKSWEVITNGISSNLTIYSLLILDDGTLFAGSGDGLYVSEDNGITWIHSGFNENCYVLSRNYNSALFAGTNNGVFRSDDDGKNWKRVGLENEKINSLCITRGVHVFAGTNNNGIFYSQNNGNNWKNFGFKNHIINSILEVPHLNMVMASAGDKIYKITADN
jgi:photosystem II stability/assembly factor-like uncharacterized protein